MKLNANVLLLTIVSMHLSSTVLAQPPGDHRRSMGAPPEAIAACKGKAVGAATSFVSPFGDTIKGHCKEKGNIIFLVPEGKSPHHSQSQKAPNR